MLITLWSGDNVSIVTDGAFIVIASITSDVDTNGNAVQALPGEMRSIALIKKEYKKWREAETVPYYRPNIESSKQVLNARKVR